jgi:APA family basic amino acid/polyamine antiporter
VTFSAGEVINAQRNYPRALLIGSAFLIGIYLLANLAYLSALGPQQAAQTDSIAATAITAVAGPATSKFVTIAILISILGAANGITMTAPRVYYAMAKDGLFFDRLAEIHPRFKTPAFAVMAGSLWAAILAVSGTFEQLLTYVVFTGWIFYALAGSSIFIYRRRVLKRDLPYSVPGYPWTPLLFVVAAVALVANTIAAQPGRAAVGLGIVFLGTPAYFIWRGSKRNPGS